VKHGNCKLCLLDKDLRVSHFLPAGVFKSLLLRSEKNPHPGFMSPTKTVETSLQMQDYLLCGDCEQRFSAKGERWVLRNMARESGFPLQEKLLKATPIRSIPGLTTYAAGPIADIDVDALEYFALSVFWRASVHNWRPILGDRYERLELGPYREGLRRFLLAGSFPKDLCTLISVFPKADFVRTTFPPTLGEKKHWDGTPYSFLIPGIQFTMVLGKKMNAETREFNSHNQPERRIFMSPGVMQQVDALRARLLAKQAALQK
jgi:hypothetical protein